MTRRVRTALRSIDRPDPRQRRIAEARKLIEQDGNRAGVLRREPDQSLRLREYDQDGGFVREWIAPAGGEELTWRS